MVNIKKTALCSACDNRYELDCDGYPEATYKLKDPEGKKNWRCRACIRNKRYNNGDVIEASNVTLRKKLTIKPSSPTELLHSTKVQRCLAPKPNSAPNSTSLFDSQVLNDCETSDESYTTPNKLSRSMDGTISDLISISDMKETINQLINKLQSTENEMENISLENQDLHKQINKLTIEITTLKSLCHSSLYESPVTNNKKIKHVPSKQNMCSTPSSPVSSRRSTKSNDNEIVLGLKQKILSLEQQLEAAQKEITALTERIYLITTTPVPPPPGTTLVTPPPGTALVTPPPPGTTLVTPPPTGTTLVTPPPGNTPVTPPLRLRQRGQTKVLEQLPKFYVERLPSGYVALNGSGWRNVY
ncbi:hypothetical protein HW555_012927 [Spodoptera exigua]|uniref:Uncharacterized protein n=1 Tax=Spodoptera exigua TaxID=7107 RepID=A0A835G2L1_SPOEX|nr:hypothetical protein HW555_012927 [Spodoptera exigua]